MCRTLENGPETMSDCGLRWNACIHISDDFCLFIDDKPWPRSTQATPTVHDVTTGSASRKITKPFVLQATDAKRTSKAGKTIGKTTFYYKQQRLEDKDKDKAKDLRFEDKDKDLWSEDSLSQSLNHHLYADDTQLFFSFIHPIFTLASPISRLLYKKSVLGWLLIYLLSTPLKLNFFSSDSNNNLPRFKTALSAPHTLLATWASSLMNTAHYPVMHWPFSKAQSAQEHHDKRSNVHHLFMRLNTVVVNLRLFIVLGYISFFSDQITAFSKSCSFHVHQLRCISPFLDIKTASTIATSIVHSQLDYCNSLYYNLPNSQLSRFLSLSLMQLLKLPSFLISLLLLNLSTG